MLDGKKTFLAATVVAVVAVLNFFGILTPDVSSVLTMLGLAGIGVGLRLAK